MRRALDSASLFPLLFGQLTTFRQLDATEEVPQFKWIHVASTGKYLGHWQGEFDLTLDVFQSFLKNLRANPQYLVGELVLDGKPIKVGCKPTIPFDYEHASEMPPSEGSIPKLGAEAPAWVLDLDVRPGADGDHQLWALAWLGEQIRDQIKRGAYRQTSIAFDLESRDWKTGEPAGPALTSIAFTNRPFLKHLESYAAANRQLPRRTSASEPAAGAPPAEPTTQRTEPMNAAATVDYEKIHNTFRANICRKLGIRVLAEDSAVEDAVGEASSSGGTLAKLLTALGVADPEAGLKVIPEFRGAREKLSAALAELDEMLAGQQAMDVEMETADVGAVMTAMKYRNDEAHRDMLKAFRQKCLSDSVAELTTAYRRRLSDDQARVPVTKVLDARRDGRLKFLKTYGIAPDGVDRSHLLTTLAASGGGTQHAPPVLPLSDRSAGNGDKETVDLRTVTGRNPTERIITHLSTKDPAFAKLTHYEQCKRATAFSQDHELVLS